MKRMFWALIWAAVLTVWPGTGQAQEWVLHEPLKVAEEMKPCMAAGGAPVSFILDSGDLAAETPLIEALVMTPNWYFSIIYIHPDQLALDFSDNGVSPPFDRAYEPLVVECFDQATNVLYPPLRLRPAHDPDDLV